jgi:hypothetical protein
MIVTSPPSPNVQFTVVPNGGSISPGVYAYAVSVNTPAPNANFVGLFQAGPFTNYPSATAAGQYWIVSKAGNLRDPVTSVLTPVVVGDQILSTAAGSVSTNFTVISNPSGIIDVGSPKNFVFPQVTIPSSQVVLDWSESITNNAIQYFIWGRVGGSTGIIGTVDSDITSFVDDGTFTPVVVPITAYSESAVRYNKLRNLNVSVDFADRQTSATFPIRDTL